MKKRILSTLMALVLCLTLLPTAAFATSESGSTAPKDDTDSTSYYEIDTDINAIAEVKAMIAALPDVSELESMSKDELSEVHDRAQHAYDAYEALTEAQQALIVGAEVFEGLFAWFNAQVTPLDDSAAPIEVTIKDASGNDKSVTLAADSNGYYQIKDADDLYAFAVAVNTEVWDEHNPEKPKKSYPYASINGKLTNDITINSNVLNTDGTLSNNSGSFRQWTPIGQSASGYYGGKFDGGYHTISGLYYNANHEKLNFIGLFGYLRYATVENLTVKDSYFYVQDPGLTTTTAFDRYDARVGGIAGYCGTDSKLNDVTVRDSYLGAKQLELIPIDDADHPLGSDGTEGPFVGGIAGESYGKDTKLQNVSVVNVQISGTAKSAFVGGIAGRSTGACVETANVESATISSTYVPDDDADSAYAGGIFGRLLTLNATDKVYFGAVKSATVDSSTTVGSSSRITYVGGIVGYSNSATIENCTNAAAITATGNSMTYPSGSAYAGGIVGAILADRGKMTIQTCTNSGAVSATCSSGTGNGTAEAHAAGIAADGFSKTDTSISIINCGSTGDVSGGAETKVYLAGVVGNCSGSGDGAHFVTGCYHVGVVQLTDPKNDSTVCYSGGITCILSQDTTFKNCCYRKDLVSAPYYPDYNYGVSENVEGLDENDFKNGSATWLLNGNSASGAWKQQLGTDNLPSLSTPSNIGTVYYGYETCKSTELTYSNEKRYAELPHQYDNTGVCSVCGKVDPSARYNIWVCGTQITKGNAGNVLQTDTANSDRVSYDVGRNTLTLNGVNLTYDDSKTLSDGEPCVGVIYAEQELTVELRGTNTITVNSRASGTDYDQYGIRVVGGNLAIRGKEKGSGGYYTHSLTISFADSSGARGSADGIYVDGGAINDLSTITINGGDATNTSHGICVKDGNVFLNGTSVNVTALGGKVTNKATSGTADALLAESCGVILRNTQEDSANGEIRISGSAKLTAKAGSTSSTAGAAHSEGIHAETVWINAKDTGVVTNCSDDSTTASGTETRLCGILANQSLSINMATVTASLTVWAGTTVKITSGTYPACFPNISLAGGDVATLHDLIGKNWEFRDKDSNAKTDRAATALKNVKVVPHSHAYGSDGACECGDIAQARLTHDTTDTIYATLNAACDNAQSGDTITLLTDAALTSGDAQCPAINTSLTLDLNGKTLTGKTSDSDDADVVIGAAVTIQGGSKLSRLTVQGTDASATLKGGVEITSGASVVGGGVLTVENAALKDTLHVGSDADGNGTLTMTGGSVETLKLYSGSAATLSGGSFTTITTEGSGLTVGALLAADYGFRSTIAGGTWRSDVSGTSINNVAVQKLPITSVRIAAEGETALKYGYSAIPTFTASVTGTADGADVSYQWYVNGTRQDGKTAATFPFPIGMNADTYTVMCEAAVDSCTVTSNNLIVTVDKITLTGEATYTAITSSGKTLADAALTADERWPDGTVQWVNEQGVPLADTTVVAANTAYTWKFTPKDSINYTSASGTVTLWQKANSGDGGGSSSNSSTTITVPVSSDHATVEVKAEVTKGNATVEVSDKQLEKVIADHAGTVTVDVSDLKNVESATVPSHVVEKTNEAENTGLMVSLPAGSVSLDETALESVTEAAGGKDVTVSVAAIPTEKLPTALKEVIGMEPTVLAVVDVNVTISGKKQSSFDGGKVTVSIPYTPKAGEDTSKLTVWFIKDDGTIENKGGYYDAKNKCFVFETDHLSQYLLVNTNEAVSFVDVPTDAYFANAVSWAASKGITGGVDGTHFMPYNACTRAQIVTFLWRAAGSPEPKASSSFSDVSADAYYAKAVVWAVENSITNGFADGTFGVNTPCTRAHAAAFLFRYAAANGMEAVTLQELVGGYYDAEQVPGYALSAFNWALANEIVQGNNGNLMPNSTCTRAQIVTMLYRLLGK